MLKNKKSIIFLDNKPLQPLMNHIYKEKLFRNTTFIHNYHSNFIAILEKRVLVKYASKHSHRRLIAKYSQTIELCSLHA
jgi:hypothetical protein